MSTSSDGSSTKSAAQAPETMKETLISIVIAFALAFVFRGFVVEAFVIPTGSMAPTLMGAHMRFQGRDTGYNWPVGPNSNQVSQTDRTPSGPDIKDVSVTDPISGEFKKHSSVRVQSGDRILVLKYLYAIQEPERFDVIVFKNPTNPQENYIKRLIGLPGEQIALVDGDVFTRSVGASGADASKSWEQPGWTIARKGRIQQEAVWQLVFDSALAPLTFAPGAAVDTGPWTPGDPKAWEMQPRRYVHAGAERAELTYDQTRPRSANSSAPPYRRLTWAIDDYYPYNETSADGGMAPPRFPVGDLRARAAITARAPGLSATLQLTVKNHDFEAVLSGATVNIRQRAAHGAAGIVGEWMDVATAPFDGFTPGAATNVEVWHQDQSLQVWINGRLVVRYDYTWSPAERVLFATGKPLSEWMTGQNDSRNVLADPSIYHAGAVKNLRWVMQGAGFEMFRVGLDRDLFYQPANMRGGPATATNPSTTLTLAPDQFFVCGDNSPASLDGRLWDNVDPWVSKEFPAPEGDAYREAGVVPRDLLLGRAFFVYWPSLKYEGKPTPVPDFGRMRMIW